MKEYTQGFTSNAVVILEDGVPITVDKVCSLLNELECLKTGLGQALPKRLEVKRALAVINRLKIKGLYIEAVIVKDLLDMVFEPLNEKLS